MKIIRFVAFASLLCLLTLPVGCTTGETGEMEEMTTEEQADIEAIREQYGSTGRYGPGGQDTPPPEAGEGETSTE